MASSQEQYHYVAYVDEAGDPGLAKVRPIDPEGASEWLVLGASIIRATREGEVSQWIDRIRTELGLDKRGAVHFRNLSISRRLAAAHIIADLPQRGFAICSNKKNMRNYRNPRAEKIPSQEWFYNWCIRLLLERITPFCEARREQDFPGQACKIKIIFSRRGGHRYSQTRAYTLYLRHQEQAGSLYLTKRQIITDLLSTDLMEHEPHWAIPGLQVADIVASAFYSAANTIGPGLWDIEPAKVLAPIMAKENGNVANFGVTLQPTPPWKAKLTKDQRLIFAHYGYEFVGW